MADAPADAAPVIDAHVHLFAPEQRAARGVLAESDAAFRELYGNPAAAMADLEDLLAAMGRAGISAAFAAGFAFADEREIRRQNEYLLACAAGTGGRVEALCTLNLARAGWEEEAERCLAAGALGFGELRPRHQGWDPLGRASERLCQLAAEAGAVLLWHTTEPVGRSYPGKGGGIAPWELLTLAERVPGASHIGGHLGGGLPFFWQMPDVRERCRNVVFDTAAAFLLYDGDSVRRLVDMAGAEAVVLGSDFPLVDPARHLRKVRATLEAEAGRRVLGGNAMRIIERRRGR
jgi:predicted TIM-barrel fold metal-dependent hydrolase